MKCVLLLACAALASGIKLQEKESKYAYVTMWLNKKATPQVVFDRVLTKAESVALNSAPTLDGLPQLMAGQKVKTSMLQTEGSPATDKQTQMAQQAQKIPLRPRNSQYRGILDIAQNLRDVGSKYPLVVLTNDEVFKNETLKAENPNLQFIWLEEKDFLERHCKIGIGHELHFQKLAIWRMTQFDKLIWIDTDIAFAKNVDYVFTSAKFPLHEGSRIYGQHDDYQCDGREWSPTGGGLCSGMLLIKPSTLHFQGLMNLQSRMQVCWGDQSIIGTYFQGARTSARPFDRNIINFARCSKKNGFMDVVHFSGSPKARRVGDVDKRAEDGQVLNSTTIAMKAAEADHKKAMDAKKAKAQEKRWAAKK